MIASKDFNIIEISRDTISNYGIIMSHGKWLCVIDVYLNKGNINKIDIDITDLTKKRTYFAKNCSGSSKSEYSDYEVSMKVFMDRTVGTVDQIKNEFEIVQELMKVCEYFDKTFKYQDFIVDNYDSYKL